MLWLESPCSWVPLFPMDETTTEQKDASSIQEYFGCSTSPTSRKKNALTESHGWHATHANDPVWRIVDGGRFVTCRRLLLPPVSIAALCCIMVRPVRWRLFDLPSRRRRLFLRSSSSRAGGAARVDTRRTVDPALCLAAGSLWPCCPPAETAVAVVVVLVFSRPRHRQAAGCCFRVTMTFSTRSNP
jgi:hypothetical protein